MNLDEICCIVNIAPMVGDVEASLGNPLRLIVHTLICSLYVVEAVYFGRFERQVMSINV